MFRVSCYNLKWFSLVSFILSNPATIQTNIASVTATAVYKKMKRGYKVRLGSHETR